MKEETRNKLRGIMQYAWQLRRTTGCTMSEAMRASWRQSSLVSKLKRGVVQFTYLKKDGSTRQAVGTLLEQAVPSTQGIRKAYPTQQCYFDLQKNAWRSFVKTNLISINQFEEVK